MPGPMRHIASPSWVWSAPLAKSTGRSSTSTAERSRWGTRSAPRARASSCTCSTCSSATTANAALRQSVSGAGWAVPCWLKERDAIMASMMSTTVRNWRLEYDLDGIAWLIFDRAGASTNSLSAEVLTELSAILAQLATAPPKGLVIRSGKDNGFIAGADIEDFERVKAVDDAIAIVKRGWDLFNQLAAVPYPTLALVRGFCLGGGLELALACRYRVVVDEPATRLGLPEVMLGIVPGWGGIRRLPRLAGAPAAL